VGGGCGAVAPFVSIVRTDPTGVATAHLALGLGVIADEQLHLGRAVMARVDFHVLLPVEANAAEGHLQALPDRVRLVRRDHVARVQARRRTARPYLSSRRSAIWILARAGLCAGRNLKVGPYGRFTQRLPRDTGELAIFDDDEIRAGLDRDLPRS